MGLRSSRLRIYTNDDNGDCTRHTTSTAIRADSPHIRSEYKTLKDYGTQQTDRETEISRFVKKDVAIILSGFLWDVRYA